MKRWFIILVLLVVGRGAYGQLPGAEVSAQAYLDRAVVVPGQEATVAVELSIVPGYHAQSARPHQPNLVPTQVRIARAPADIKVGPPRYPVGKDIKTRALGAEENVSVYEDGAIILLPVVVAADAAPGLREIALEVETQACDEQSCLLPKTLPLSVKFIIGTPGQAVGGAILHADVFARARQQAFYEPSTTSAPAQTVPETGPGGFTVSATANGGATPAEKWREHVEWEIAQITQRDYQPRDDEPAGLWKLILFALLGGAILNIMPCVLPVIPLKVLTLVQQAHGSRRQALAHGLVFAAGVVALFVALALALGVYHIFVRGPVVYGEQYNSPLFLITMSMVVLALAFSMFGVWTIQPPRAVYAAEVRAGYTGSFFMGVLATLLATPCSAPLLGPVLAWALVQPLTVTVLAFALVGVGMAAPYVALAAFPGWLTKLPRAGRWSELLKQFLGIIMVGVALYLLKQTPTPVWPWAAAGGLVLALVCWGWGQLPDINMTALRVWAIRAAVLVVGCGLGFGVYQIGRSRLGPEMMEPARTTGDWQPFDLAKMDTALAAGRPVVVDFTASWCINCIFVEATVLDAQTVRQAFHENHALLLRADLADRASVALLAKLRSLSIPVLAVFAPAEPLRPVVLRDLYTRGRVILELEAAGRGGPAPQPGTEPGI